MSNQARRTQPAKNTAQAAKAQKPAKVALSASLQSSDSLPLAIADPRAAAPADVLRLQRVAGNRATSRLIQRKLVVGASHDPYEQEADRVAEKVVKDEGGKMKSESSRPSVQRQGEEEEEVQTKPLVQRQGEEEEEVQTKSLVQRQGEEEEEEVQTKPLVQRQGEEEEEEVQTKPLVQRQSGAEEMQRAPLASTITRTTAQAPAGEAASQIQITPQVQASPLGGRFAVDGNIERQIVRTRGSGSSLPDHVRDEMESHFGADFSGVRVHADAESGAMNQALHAKAFTHGRDIYFGASRYNPDASSGKQLLAHELTHVVQQGGVQLKRSNGHEREPEETSVPPKNSLAGAPPQVSTKPENVIQRDWRQTLADIKQLPHKAGTAIKTRWTAGASTRQKIRQAPGKAWAAFKRGAGAKRTAIKTGWGQFKTGAKTKWGAFKTAAGAKRRAIGTGWGQFKTGAKTKWGAFKTGAGAKRTAAKQWWSAGATKRHQAWESTKKGGKTLLTGAGPDVTTGTKWGKRGKKVVKVAMGVSEGLLNSALALVNPRWYAKMVSDIRDIKPEEYGGGKAGEHLVRLSRASQSFQKIMTVLGIISLALGIAGTILTGAVGAGAALLAVSSILGLISIIFAGAVFVMQNVLFWWNVAHYRSATPEQKKRMWSDLAAGIGAALAAIGGGLGLSPAAFIPGAAPAVIEPLTSHIPSDIGKTIAQTGIGQVFGTTSDITSESIGVMTAEDDETPEPAPSSGGATPEQVVAAVGEVAPLVIGEGTASTTQALKDQKGLGESLKAVNQSLEALNMPADKAPAPENIKKQAQGKSMPVAQGLQAAPGLLNDANQALDQGTQDAARPGHVEDSKESMLVKADSDLGKVEAEMGIEAEPEEKKKPSVGQRIKGWLATPFKALKKRIARVLARAKAKIISITLEVMGVKEPIAGVVEGLTDKQAQTPRGIADAVGVASEATRAAESAKQLQEAAAKLGK